MSSRRALYTTAIATLALILTTLAQPAEAQRGRQARGGDADSAAQNPLARAVRGLRLRGIGPALVSGRISDIAVQDDDRSTWYIATASGGVWKTTNAGTTFSPIMDSQGSYSFGVIVIDPNHPHIVWAGSGENNPQRSVSYGDGVYKSVDGGRTWRNVGLRNSEHIARILIDPRNSDVVYVASQGPVFNSGGDRGLYKTTDGGETWTKILDAGEWAGVTDIVMDPRNPDVLIAATWQRARRQWTLIAGGPASGLHRSTDGGATWTRAQRGLTNEELGRIGLAMSPVDPDIVYAVVEAANDGSGFYRSTNNGLSWQRMSDQSSSGNYYQEIFADPVNVDRVYLMNTRLAVTDDGGRTWRTIDPGHKHVDNHAIWIDPDDNDHFLIGTDGGLYETFDQGENYTWFPNLPLGQFYRVEVDSTQPFYRVFGGTQDNSSVGGPSRTRTRRGADAGDWFLTQGGDGFYSRIDPTNPNIIYAESQYAGLTRFNLATGERVFIRPEAEPGDPPLRWHWDAPLVISPHNPARLYFAAQRVFRSDDRGSTWTPISGDLTAQIDRNRLRVMGRVWSVDAVAKNRSTSPWNSIVTMAESYLQEGLLWVGTDDGVIQVTEDGGQTWRRIGPIRGVPETTFVSRVTPSVHDVNTVYVSFDNHKSGDYRPYIAKSTDLGRSWELIHSNLPERGSVYVVLEDYQNPDMLYAGTEFGLYFTNNGGEEWIELGSGLPTIMVRDLALQTQHDDLVLATFGRGFYIFEHLETLRALTPEFLAGEGGLLPVNRAPMFILSNPDPGWQGAQFWTAENPPVGATFFYYNPEATRTRRQERQRRERAAARRGEDVFYPTWEELRAEDLEDRPTMLLTITDAEGRVVRRLTGSTSAGLQRVTWNLRYPSAAPVRGQGGGGGGFGGGFFFGGGGGPFVAPGTYTVSLAKVADGAVTPVGSPQSFEVYPLDGPAGTRTPEVVAFQQRAWRLQRAGLGAAAAANEAMTRINALERALGETPAADPQLLVDLRAVEDSIRAIQWTLTGEPTMGRRNEPSPPSLQTRLGRFTGGAWTGSLTEVTGTQRRQYDILAGEMQGVLDRLRRAIEVELKRIEDAAEAAGAPWTSGRIPSWRP